MIATIILLVILVVVAVVILLKAVRIIPQARAGIVERLGKYQSTLSPGLHILVPFIDRLLPMIDLREQVVSFPAQSVITEDNLVVGIDTVVYFQVTDPRSATYEITNYIHAVDELTSATLRNVVGGLNLEETLTSRDKINAELRGVLDSTTGRWGLRVSRVDIKEITPPASIQDSMEKQMRADREKRATILTAEGQREAAITTAQGAKQAAILDAEGNKQAAILAAEADRQSRMLRAQGERAARYLVAEGQAAAIARVNAAVKASKPTPEMLAYQYVQNLPEMAKGDAATMWMIPSQFGDSLENFAKAVAKKDDDGVFRYEPSEVDTDADLPSAPDEWFDTSTDPEIARSVALAEAAAKGTSVEDEEVRASKPKPGVFDMVPESEGGAAPDTSAPRHAAPGYGEQQQQQQPQQQYGAPAIGGPQAPQPGTQPHEPFPGYTAYPAEGEQPR